MDSIKEKIEMAMIERISTLVKQYSDDGLNASEIANLIGSSTVEIVDYYKSRDVRRARREARKKEKELEL